MPVCEQASCLSVFSPLKRKIWAAALLQCMCLLAAEDQRGNSALEGADKMLAVCNYLMLRSDNQLFPN